MQDDLNAKLNFIWDSCFPRDGSVLAPLYFDDILPNSVLCIGINPSFNAVYLENALKLVRPGNNMDASEVFRWKGPESLAVDQCVELQRHAKTTIDYYRFHREAFEGLSIPWAQIDLYRYRTSKQEDMDSVVERYPDFAKRSIELFSEAISAYRPQALFVLNSSVVRTLNAMFTSRYCSSEGHHWVNINNVDVPAIFSGQVNRSMASPNKQLLLWYARRFLRRLESGELAPLPL